jgi:hypothetical protein
MITGFLHSLAFADSGADFWFGPGAVGVLIVIGGSLGSEPSKPKIRGSTNRRKPKQETRSPRSDA